MAEGSWSASSDGPVRKDGPLAVPSPTNIGLAANAQFELAVQVATQLATLVGAPHGVVTVNVQGHAQLGGDGEFITVQVASLPEAKGKKKS